MLSVPDGDDSAHARPGDRTPALATVGISKAFGSTQALDDVAIEVKRGTIHALLGANGSGKSTMVKVMAGVEQADEGQVRVGERVVAASALTPTVAFDAGMRFVHQATSTFTEMSVAENLAIGYGYQRGAFGRIRWRDQRRRAAILLDRFRIDVDPETPLRLLSRGQQAMVAIARALQDQEGATEGILVLDEPTAALPADEANLLLDALRRYAAQGQTIIYITHRLDEVEDVADAATVLRNGRVVASFDREEMSKTQLIQAMLGREMTALLTQKSQRTHHRVFLHVRDLRGRALRAASFELNSGEILGVAGLLGSGRSTLLRLLFGLVQRESGEVEYDGAKVDFRGPREAMEAGVAYVPEDRYGEAAFADMTITDNLGIAMTGTHWSRGRLRHAAERDTARDLMTTFDIKARSPDALLSSISGGNQQKTILARWLRRRPRLLLLDDPTQGVDVGASGEIHELIRASAAAGASVMVVSSEFDELEMLCDRVLIMRRGCVEGEAAGAWVTSDRLEELVH